jgi:hypothetical protein
MSLDVFAQQSPVLQVTIKDKFKTIEISSCPEKSCNNHLKEINTTFCDSCGSKITNVSKNVVLNADLLSSNMDDLVIIEEDSFACSLFDQYLDNSECVEHNYVLLRQYSEESQKSMIDKFNEKYKTLFNKFYELGLTYKVEFRTFVNLSR